MKDETLHRRQAIKQLICSQQISDQQHLVSLLKQLHGIETNQAAISRDLHQLQVVKKMVKGAIVYELAQTNVTEELLKLAVIDIVHNEVMIVVKTHAGLAAFVGDSIDQYHEIGILGTLAGENIVFVTPCSIKNIGAVFAELCQKLFFKNK